MDKTIENKIQKFETEIGISLDEEQKGRLEKVFKGEMSYEEHRAIVLNEIEKITNRVKQLTEEYFGTKS